jgi:hypothetical protein
VIAMLAESMLQDFVLVITTAHNVAVLPYL